MASSITVGCIIISLFSVVGEEGEWAVLVVFDMVVVLLLDDDDGDEKELVKAR